MEEDYKIYLGICVQNNDPEMRGRIKVYIPRISPTVTKLNENVDKFFTFIGKETNPQITQVLEDIKAQLPWAEYAGPICGGNASGRYNAQTDNGTTSDSNGWEEGQIIAGFRPVNNYVAEREYPDAFTQTGLHKNKFVNQYAHQYTPTNYSGMARGLFSIPNVGAHVYIFFANGDRNFPTYFAAAYSEEDIKRIFTLSQDVNDNTSADYPASYENIKKTTQDADTKTFRSKTVLNSNKNTIELVDTDLREMIKMTHYSGSFKEFNNYSTIELATGNDQKLVIGDKFLTVKKNNSEYVAMHKELITGGDFYINIGETNQDIVKQILNIHKEFHEYKMLFDVRRAKYGEVTTYGNPNDMSKYQTRQGTYAKCPVCGGKPYLPYDPIYTATGKGDPTELWYQQGDWKGEFCVIGQLPEEGSTEELVLFSPSCHTYYLAGVSEGEQEEGCVYVNHPYEGQIGYFAGMECQCCQGSGRSPSSEGGRFAIEDHKKANGTLDQLILSKTPDLFKLEKQLGMGGDKIETISMNKIETIGLAMNDMKSYRVDPAGKLKIDGCWVAPQKTYDNYKISPHVEYVDVADIPGGDYILTCMNKYKLLVGARGVNIETYGPLDIYGTICNYTGEQINISSKNEIVVDGGERCSIRARKISLLPVEHNAVVVDGQLHVTRNSIFEGGLMIEGEIGLLHITAPSEWAETTKEVYDPADTCSITPVTYDPSTLTLTIPKHVHYFQRIPVTFKKNREQVREEMMSKGINSRINIAAASPTDVSLLGSGCSGSLWNAVSVKFTTAGWNACKESAKAKGIDADSDWANWTNSSGGYASPGADGTNGPMTNSVGGGRKCTPDGDNYTIEANYTWYWGGEQGTVKIKGTATSEGDLISGPTAS